MENFLILVYIVGHLIGSIMDSFTLAFMPEKILVFIDEQQNSPLTIKAVMSAKITAIIVRMRLYKEDGRGAVDIYLLPMSFLNCGFGYAARNCCHIVSYSR